MKNEVANLALQLQDGSQMEMKTYQTDDLFCLDRQDIEVFLNDFLCNDSVDPYSDTLLARPGFQPDSFTVTDRFSDPGFLSPWERDTHQYLRLLVASEVEKATTEGLFILTDPISATDFIVEQLIKLLEYQLNGTPVAAQLFNQELPDVVKKVISFCIFDNPNVELHTYKSFNEVGERIVPIILERHLLEKHDIHELLVYSIAAGLIGLDLKGTKAAASSFTNMGIELRPLLKLHAVSTADAIYEELELLVSAQPAIDHWDAFANEVLGERACKLVWFLDDFIETMFDLHLAYRFLTQNHFLEIVLVPKNGQHGNDASYVDTMRTLRLPVLSSLSSYLESGRLRISSKGPRMGAVNIRKLSREVVHEVKTASVVYVKGCRMHEMLQGGIDAVTYTSFVVTREFTESETGLDARCAPIVFFRSEPGEYAYWGFKGRKMRRKAFSDGRQIRICYSTTEEHEIRKTTNDPNILIAELNKLVSLHNSITSEYRYQYDAETRLLVDRLSHFTRLTYNATAQRYSDIRKQQPSKKDADLMNELLELARARAKEGRLGDKDGRISILDVGTGHGRDLRFLSQFDDVTAVGIDNAQAFIQILHKLASEGEIPGGSFYEMDMRDLRGFEDAAFDVVRHNATLLHLPMVPNRIGADEAVAESFRVLKPSGVLYVLVKAGEGLECTDTGERLGARVYQYYTRESLTELLERNGFRILETRERFSQRPTGLVEWILALAEKPGE